MNYQRAKVLIFSSSYVPVLGGLQTVTHNLATQLVARGHEVRVVTNRYPVQLPAREVIDGVTVDRLLFLKPGTDQLRNGRFDLFTAGLYYGPSSHRQLKQIVNEFRPDVVNVHFPEHEIELLLELRKELNFRLVVSLHGYDVQQFDNGNGLKKSTVAKAERLSLLLESADAITTVSRDLLDKASQLNPKIISKSHVISNGIDIHRFTHSTPYSHERPYVFAFGRLLYKKGFDLLIEAFAKADFATRGDLIIAGVGEELPALKAQVNELGLTGNVHFFGQASPDEVASLLKSSLGAVVPSREEQFGIVALEVLAAGKPLVATMTGGLQEWLTALMRDNSQDLSARITLVEATVEGITSGLCALRDRQDSPTQFRIPEEYTWRHIAGRYEQVMLPAREHKAFTANG